MGARNHGQWVGLRNARSDLRVMDHGIRTLERAFQLARAGDCASVSDIKKRLIAEGFSGEQITGPVLSKQLKELIPAARE